MTTEQLALDADCCKFRDCPRPVIGHSTTWKGKVCKGHNEQEWGENLCQHDPALSRRLLADSARSLGQDHEHQGIDSDV